MAEQNATHAADQKAAPQFAMQRIYVKDISFETPNSPAIFTKEWKPDVNLDLDNKSVKIDEGVYEVTLAITVTAKVEGEVAFLCEVQQAGIFAIGNMPEGQIAQMLGAFCPNTLFPYARETISNIVNRGSFPALNLAPVNFDALFAQYVQQAKAKAEGQEQKLDA